MASRGVTRRVASRPKAATPSGWVRMKFGVFHTLVSRLSRSSGVGGPVSVLMVWSGTTCASRPYSSLLISSLSWRSLIVSMVSRNCWLT